MANKEIDQKILEQMNEELDLYIPSGVDTEEDLIKYQNLFTSLHKLYYLGDSGKESVAQYFTKFYHASDDEKSEIMVYLDNDIDYHIRQKEIRDSLIEDARVEFLLGMYKALPNDGKVEYLFSLDNEGRLPEQGDDLGKYQQVVAQEQEEMQQAQQQAAMQQQAMNYNQPMNPDMVASRYLNQARQGNRAPMGQRQQQQQGFRVDGR